jgi:SAM-dependent methyltransferase
VGLYNNAGAPVSQIEQGARLRVRISIHYLQALQRPNCGLVLKNRHGIDVLGTNCLEEGYAMPPARPGETRTLEFAFQVPDLLPGDYTVTIAAADGSTEDNITADWVHHAVAMTIMGSYRTGTLLWVPTAIETWLDQDAGHGVGLNQAVSANVESTNSLGVVERSTLILEQPRPDEAAALAPADDDLIPPPELIYVGGGDFKAIGRYFVDWFIAHCDLRPNNRVLDVGCGIGRVAVPLTKYLNAEGCYEGFDIVPKGIEWCQQHITPRFPNFRFQLAGIYNTSYNPTATVRASEYVFPYPDGWFDLVFLTSVFTHMLPADVEHYLVEIARVLRPGGRCFATFFLLDDVSRELIAAGKSLLPFHHSLGDLVTTDPARPEDAAAYPESMVRDLFQEAGLAIIEPIRHGYWSGRANGESYQDIVLAIKKA